MTTSAPAAASDAGDPDRVDPRDVAEREAQADRAGKQVRGRASPGHGTDEPLQVGDPGRPDPGDRIEAVDGGEGAVRPGGTR